MRYIQLIIIIAVTLFTIVLPATAATPETLPPLSVGWIYTPLSSGLTVKVPVQDNFYLQPLFSVDVSNGAQSADGSYGLGLRGIMAFPLTNGLYPYIGAGIGHSRSFHGTSMGNSTTDSEQMGFETFFGLEMQKSFIHPAIEIGILGLHRSDNTFHLGTSVNVGAYFYL